MAFHTRPYLVDVLLGDPAAEPLWASAIWSAVADSLDPLMSSSRGRTAVRSLQYSARKVMRFGRIGWNKAGHQKWTHTAAQLSDSDRSFGSVEVWAPSWTVCGTEDRPPDTFLWIQNEAAIFSRSVSFNPTILLATAKDCDALDERRLTAVRALASVTHPLLHVRKERTWGNAWAVGFTDAIQDLVVTGLFRPGKRHGGVPTVDAFAEAWSEVSGLTRACS
jgi:hypothetical protein